MEKIIFFDEDTQFDFMMPGGRLYVNGAKAIIPKIRKLTVLADRCGIPIISSMDAHVKNDPEFKMFPAHCVIKTKGAAKIKESVAAKTKQFFIPKRTLDAFSNPRTRKILKKFDAAFVYGVALDYCVKAACLGLVKMGIKTYLVIDATKAISNDSGSKAKALLKGKGVIFIKTDTLIRRLSKCKRE
jgi:nicotinamidase/pyrazinamidase